jgi:hypothetical protein
VLVHSGPICINACFLAEQALGSSGLKRQDSGGDGDDDDDDDEES